jgi:hypothetical protein
LPKEEVCVKYCQVGGGILFRASSLAFRECAQHSVQWTLGNLHVFKQFSTPQPFPFGRRSAVRPTTTNANRWLLTHKIEDGYYDESRTTNQDTIWN